MVGRKFLAIMCLVLIAVAIAGCDDDSDSSSEYWVDCPHCEQKVDIGSYSDGDILTCPHCGKPSVVQEYTVVY